jgi:fatty-acyl-CoA synthase
MTHHRPWFALWRSGAPKTLEPYPEASAYSMLVGAAAAYPDSVALAFLGKHITYRVMLEEVERFSAGLAGLGVMQGDRVALFMQNCPQFPIAVQAILRADAVVVPVNPMNKADEFGHYITDSGARVAITTADLAGIVAQADAQVASAGAPVMRDLYRNSRAQVRLGLLPLQRGLTEQFRER